MQKKLTIIAVIIMSMAVGSVLAKTSPFNKTQTSPTKDRQVTARSTEKSAQLLEQLLAEAKKTNNLLQQIAAKR